MSAAWPRRIHFHVGSHKTATTYMQSRLRDNRDRLGELGTRFVDLWAGTAEEANYRASLRGALEGKTINRKKQDEATHRLRGLVERQLPQGSADERLLVLSCEVPLGNYDPTHGLYPHARWGIEHITQAFPESDIKLFFCFRRFDRFLESGYIQRVLGRHETRGFEQYLATIDTAALSWIPVIEAMESVVGAANVATWAYEDFAEGEGRVWQALLGLDDWRDALPKQATRTNPSLSQKGLDYKRAINGHVAAVDDVDDRRKFRTLVNSGFFLKFMKNNFGVQTGQDAPDLFEPSRREALLRQYEREVAEIRKARRLVI